MRVLVACEYSGVVRSAFQARGHTAVSCDLLPTDNPHGWHVQGDVLRILDHGWDLMVCHPPCTFLTNSGERWMKDNPERQEQRRQAVEFVRALLAAPIPRIALENPIGHLSTAIRKPDQIIQPWMFGHGETKSTCLWLKGLPKLIPTNLVDGREPRVHWMPPSADRWKLRSTTYAGIGAAMADQWGSRLVEQLEIAA